MVETVPPLLGAGVRFLTAGAILLTAVLLLGRRKRLRVTPREALAAAAVGILILVLIGSVVAYSAFVWLLQNASASTVATYAYVNPAVALILGWAILSEQITPTILVGALMILACVALAARGEEKRTAEEESDPRRYSDDLAPSRTARSDPRDDSASSS
jgi:drug/metabolite transporter (DMT)-like permease